MITAERLRDVLAYEKTTGLFRWRVRTSNRINIGDIAGSKHRDGFRKIAVDGKTTCNTEYARTTSAANGP